MNKYNVGDQMVIESTITPTTTRALGPATAATCTWTDPLRVARTPVAMTNDAGTWWAISPTFDVPGQWSYAVTITAGLVGVESGSFRVI